MKGVFEKVMMTPIDISPSPCPTQYDMALHAEFCLRMSCHFRIYCKQTHANTTLNYLIDYFKPSSLKILIYGEQKVHALKFSTYFNTCTKNRTNTSSRTACRPSSSVVLQLMDWCTSLASSGTLAFSRSKISHSNSL